MDYARICFFSLIVLLMQRGDAALSDACKYCSLMVDTFNAGMKKTENQHFAGGNSDWEERKLGKFAKSETRLVEIMEYLCKMRHLDSTEKFTGVKDIEFKCQQLVEEHEELIELWYFKKQLSDPEMAIFICHEKLKLCCPKGHFGGQCDACPGVDKGLPPCSNHGTCDGEGSRFGTGKCECNRGYLGVTCSHCEPNYFTVTGAINGSLDCKECDRSCEGGCVGEGAVGCKGCRSGWVMEKYVGCKDVNECLNPDQCKAVGQNLECHNLEGSFECRCKSGYERNKMKQCIVDVHAPPEVVWFRVDQMLRTFSISGMCVLMVAVVWRRSIPLAIFAAFCLLFAIYIEFNLDYTSLPFE